MGVSFVARTLGPMPHDRSFGTGCIDGDQRTGPRSFLDLLRHLAVVQRCYKGDAADHVADQGGHEECADIGADPCLAAEHQVGRVDRADDYVAEAAERDGRSEEHTSELQSLMRISYAVFCLKKKNQISIQT